MWVRGSADGIALFFVNRRQGGAERPLFGPQCSATAMQDDGSAVAIPGGAKMRRQQRIDPQLRIAVEATFDRQHIAPCIRSHTQ